MWVQLKSTFSELFHTFFNKLCEVSVENTFFFRRPAPWYQIKVFREPHPCLCIIQFSPLQLKSSTNTSCAHYPDLMWTFFTVLYITEMQQNLLKWVSDKRMGLLKMEAHKSPILCEFSAKVHCSTTWHLLNSVSLLTPSYSVNWEQHLPLKWRRCCKLKGKSICYFIPQIFTFI